MRILLDESVPARLGPLLAGHITVSVRKRGWSGISNGELLSRAAAEFDLLLTADKGIEHQQNLSRLPVAVLVVLAKSNRLHDLEPLVPVILKTLNHIKPRTLQKIGG